MTSPATTQNKQSDAVKNALISLSEKIVDYIDALENADPQTDANKIRKASRELHHAGDELLGYRSECSGDDLAFVNFMLGSVCYQLGYLDKADEAYAMALETWPDHVGLLNEYFLALTDLKKYGRAYEIIQQSIRIGGETPDVLQNMATVLVQLDRVAEAKAVLFNCLAKFPDDLESQKLLAELDKNY